MNDLPTRQAIVNSLAGFATKPLAEAASEFFSSLGYHSERRMEFPSFAAFFSEFDREGKAAQHFRTVNPAERGKTVLVQQLTSEELAANSSGQFDLARSTSTDLRQIDSYLFLTAPVEEECTRTTLANRARALNGLFKQPVLVLFRHGTLISLAITYRRTSKHDQSRDVIERKVTFIKDILCRQPHPGHVAILHDFSLSALSNARGRDIRNFADLDDAWREALSTQLLNRQFYDEIANWYFWARDHWIHGAVKLPSDVKSEADASLFFIRLLTRLIFCWFLKEKRNPETGTGLIPDELFDPPRIRELLRDSSPNAGTYYVAILQNLFFATLNSEMDVTGSAPSRRFIEKKGAKGKEDHMAHQLWRNPELLSNPQEFERLFRKIPFLNGGLFECLDQRIEKANSSLTTEIRLDGFSSVPEKQPELRNVLFFNVDDEPGFIYNLSEAYGDATRSRVVVRPLLTIFQGYKFTLTENTPIEEEVALDPELLGHVFENLLAAYNPETGTVARKTTGSFYTPRVAVDWMVDEALVVYLNKRVPQVSEEKLRDLLSWNPIPVELTAAQRDALIDAVDSLKALDPACGSGAFPMGLLQKLVHLLKQIDPDNKGWQRLQINAAKTVPSVSAREAALTAIKLAFARDNDDYGRKLYLIENCLYGVDIQPIAVQIAKLRFFIALIVDQKISPKEKNYGVLALPNLETKIVAANTLLGLKRGQLLLGSDNVRQLERELQQVRHDYFTARSYSEKKALRKQDKELCDQLSDALVFSGELSPADSKRVTGWNPYSATTAAPFFDAGWMFGLPAKEGDGVFDLLIGNPPYVRQEELKNVIVQDSNGKASPLKDVLKGQYECFTGTADLYVYFFERSFQLLRTGGVLSFITSNKYFRAAYGERLRTYLLYATQPRVVLDFGDSPVFTAVAYPCIVVTQKTRHINIGDLPNPDEFKQADRVRQFLPEPDRTFRVMTWTPGPPIREFPLLFDEKAFPLAQRELKPIGWQLESPSGLRLLERIRAVGKPLREFLGKRVYRGLTTGFNDAFVVDRETRDRLIAEHRSSKELLKPYFRGKDVERWTAQQSEQYLIKIPSSENHKHPWSGKGKTEAERVFERTYPAIHKFHNGFRKKLIARYDQGHYFWELRACAYWEDFENPKILSTKISIRPTFAIDTSGSYLANTVYFFPAVKSAASYLLALLNSALFFGYAKRVFVEKQSGWYEVQPDGLESFPIPAATPQQQHLCEQLAEALIWLHHPSAGPNVADAPVSLMAAYFEQWLNGLVYELYFAGELHSRGLRLFDESAKFFQSPLGKPSETQKLSRLKEIFEQAYDTNSAIRSMLFSLRSLEVVQDH